MSTATKRRYTDEFKREAVAHWQASGKMQTEVARELGIQPSLLRRWQVRIDSAGAGPLSPPAPPPRSASLPMPADQASEIAKLKRELDRMRIERDILKKAVGIFAEMPR